MGPQQRCCGIVVGPSSSLTKYSRLQWGRSSAAAELAALLSYSVFKDLRKALRAVHPAAPEWLTPAKRRRLEVPWNHTPNCSRAVAGVRFPPDRSHGLTRHENGVVGHFSFQNPRQQPRLHFQQPAVADAVFEDRVGNERIHS